MTGSMYAAVSGLKAHMSALNVIGNNVANVNTLGYKTTRYTFNEALYTTQIGGSDGTNQVGGRNPAQVGFGASIGTIDLDMSTKNYTPTGKQLDTMIDGDGFFIVGDKFVGDENDPKYGINPEISDDKSTLAGMNLTRLGNFEFDSNGYLVDGNGSVVWGYLTTAEETTTTDDDGNEVTTPAKVSTVLTAIRLPQYTKDENGTITVQYPQEAGADGKAVAEGGKPAQLLDADVYANNNTDAAGGEGGDDTAPITYEQLKGDSYSIDPNSGAITAMTNTGKQVTIGYLAIAKVDNPNGVTHVDGRYYQAQKGAGDVRLTTVKGAVAGVESAGDTKLITGGLESSGTDLATEITNMITVQRGYQANTRIITVTDSMLEELVNMKR